MKSMQDGRALNEDVTSSKLATSSNALVFPTLSLKLYGFFTPSLSPTLFNRTEAFGADSSTSLSSDSSSVESSASSSSYVSSPLFFPFSFSASSSHLITYKSHLYTLHAFSLAVPTNLPSSLFNQTLLKVMHSTVQRCHLALQVYRVSPSSTSSSSSSHHHIRPGKMMQSVGHAACIPCPFRFDTHTHTQTRTTIVLHTAAHTSRACDVMMSLMTHLLS